MSRASQAKGHPYCGFEAVPLRVAVRVGGTTLTLRRLAALEPGSVIVLDRPVGAPMDLIVHDRKLARVEAFALGGGVGLKLAAVAEQDDTDGA